ncbi:MAG: 1-(5-phosphoribosyl)-5-[(5-phosphoribosylamino)methylideneamino]imidazole-4-carboxamide isomerase [Firmicutes bacterium]|nr:1-(5-phosphoribosyl)-5-[(5-phosphoribosylamino)methylideneamino]imidazole-4-carboxamide isomerase [Bacillota bacterium]
MVIIPAIDIRGGRCVRLVRGEKERETVYADDPVTVACEFAAAGAKRLHVVDLDGAFAGQMQNGGLIAGIVQAVKIPVQVGGGIRTRQAAEALLDCGVSRVILGTAAVTDPQLVSDLCTRYSGRIMAGIDARDGMVAIRGWVEEADLTAMELARRLADLGITEIVYTDILRDGTLTGPNLKALREMATSVPVEVIASGGISSLEDIRQLLPLRRLGVKGVIIGQAFYTGKISLPEALALTEEM